MTPVFNWEQAYIPIIEDAQAGEWEAGYTFPGIADGAVEVSDPGPEVPQEVIDEVTSIQEEMTGGDADDVVWSGTPYEDWTEEEILFESDTLGVDNIEGQEL
jgi:basic membrane lipoprotein Med (substrate-binding protein (PBP1-ABC) superfamily)